MKVLVSNLCILACDVKTAHWNIVGSYFYGLHALFDEVDEVARKHQNQLATRLRYLGETPSILPEDLIKRNIMQPLPVDFGYKEITEVIIENIQELCDYADYLRGNYGDCESAMLSEMQKDLGEYIYKLSAMIS